LRGLAQAQQVAEILGRALIVAANERGDAVNAAPEAGVSIATETRVVASDAVAA
jgi:hypothetical protein